MKAKPPATIGLLMSGGLDSSILLGHLLDLGERVQPFYVRSGLAWQRAELGAVRRFLRAVASPRLAQIVTLDLPLADVYDGHWSLTGRGTPGRGTPDEAVFLPGRNALLAIKAAVWCQLRGIGRLAVGSLATNPFDDATSDFFDDFQSALNHGAPQKLRIERPFATLDKRQVMELGCKLPLRLTFSCIAPRQGRHCGACNKCEERQAAFRLAGLADPTNYAEATPCSR